MRAVLVAVGSRGDAEPFCAVAAEILQRDGDSAHLFLQIDQQKLAPRGADVHTLPFSTNDFYKYTASPSKGGESANPRVRFTGVIADVVAELVLPCMKNILEVSREADMIIASSLARVPALIVGKHLHIPVAIVHLQPMTPTADFPHYSDTEACVEAIMHPPSSNPLQNMEYYWMLERTQHDFLDERVAAACRELGVEALSFEGYLKPALGGIHPDVLIANGFSAELVPSTSDRGIHVHDVGPLADAFIMSGWEPPPELIAFLEDCKEPPICVGFGSMPFDKATFIIEALRQTGDRAVLVGDAFKLDNVGVVSDGIFQVSSVPYPWLLPRCSMMISHGGAGVVNATLRAGIPPVIFPLFGDQPFWASLVDALGIGVHAPPLGSVTAKEVTNSICHAHECKAKAMAVGKAIRARPKTGAVVFADLLRDHISNR